MARVAEDVGRRARPEKVPPQNLEAEESVLGSMMLSAEAIADVIEIARPEDFYRSSHRTIYETLLSVYARGEPVDAITAVEELKRRSILEDVGGPLRIHELVERVPTPASAAYYARIVSELALLRRLIHAAADILELAYSVPEDPQHAADQAEAMVYAVSRRHEQEEVVPVRALVDQAMIDLENIQQRDSAYAGVPTGFRDLDTLLSGLQRGNLLVVAARPGVGKSSFVTNLARNVAVDARAAVAMFSLEMSRWEIGMRLLCGDAKVPWDRVRAGRVGPDDWSRIVEAAEGLHDAPLYIVDAGNVTIVDIRAKARRLRQQHNLGLLIVDYLQLMSHHGRVENRQQEIAEISRSLKLLAKELDIPVIAVSQLNRQVESRSDKRPQLSDLRECVTGDTRVALADGRHAPIADLVGTQPEVLAISSEGRIITARSDKVWCVGRRPVFEVALASGRMIRCTGRHRLYGASGWVRVQDLAVGDRLAIARRLPEPDDAVEWPDDRVAVLGQLIGDGRYLNNAPMRYSTASEENRALVTAGAERVNAWLRELGIFGQRSSDKRIPEYAQILQDDELRLQATNDLFWDRVTSLECVREEEVFDLTVPGPASWVGNGIVSHNSGAIEQDSDIVMFIHRDDSEDPDKKGTADLIVAKHRNGPTDTVKLTFLPHLTQFRNYASGP